ncbi:hypothetical protein J1N35_014789, partial [Gossypium stocksii]
MAYFLLPRPLCANLESIIANFWRQKGRGKKDIQLVLDLIDASNRTSKAKMNVNTFSADIARKILHIPLAKVVHDYFQVWRGELS